MAHDASLVSGFSGACVCVGRCIRRHLTGPLKARHFTATEGNRSRRVLLLPGLMRFTRRQCTRSSLRGRKDATWKCHTHHVPLPLGPSRRAPEAHAARSADALRDTKMPPCHSGTPTCFVSLRFARHWHLRRWVASGRGCTFRLMETEVN